MGRKMRYVGFCATDWIGGTVGLTLEERGLYITAVAMIYAAAGPIELNALRHGCGGISARAFRTILGRLVALGKLERDGDFIGNNRCRKELAKAHKKADIALANLPKTEKNDQKNEKKTPEKEQKTPSFLTPVLSEISELPDARRGPHARNIFDSEGETKKEEKDLSLRGDLGRCAPSELLPISEDEKAEVSELLERTAAALKGDVPKAICDRLAYEATIKKNKFASFLRGLNQWASENLSDALRWRAWEVLAIAESAGSRQAMPAAARRRLDELDRQRRATEPQELAA